MQQLQIPQSPMVAPNGFVTQEWLVFINELMRLNNNVISSDVVDVVNESELTSIAASNIAPYFEESALSTYVAPVITQDEQINNIALALVQDEPISNVQLHMNHDEPIDTNPYALMSAIEQQQYEQQIWSLTV